MRYFPLLWANLMRRKLRTVLTAASFAVALFLFGLLAAIRSAMNQGAELSRADRLVVINRASITQMLPLSLYAKLARIPGVKAVDHATWFGGVYRDERNSFPQYAVDAETLRLVYPEYAVAQGDWEELLRDRQGCMAGEATARRFGWKVGDRIPIKGSYLQGVFEFNLRAIYKGTGPDVDTTLFYFHYACLEQVYEGDVGWYVVKLERPSDAQRVIKTIDETFANSSCETKSQTEKEFGTYFAKQLGDIEPLVAAIGSVVFATLLLVSANTMAMALRERTAELAILKAIGFGNGQLLLLAVAESLFLAASGGVPGVLAASFACGRLSGMFPGMVLHLSPAAMAAGSALAISVGALGAALPASAIARMRIATALRRM